MQGERYETQFLTKNWLIRLIVRGVMKGYNSNLYVYIYIYSLQNICLTVDHYFLFN